MAFFKVEGKIHKLLYLLKILSEVIILQEILKSNNQQFKYTSFISTPNMQLKIKV